MFNFSTNTLKNKVLFHNKSSIFLFSLLLLAIVFNPQYSSAFFYNNQGNSLLYGNVGSASSLYSNPGASYGPNMGLMYGGGEINNGFGMMPGYGYGGSSFGSGGLLDVLSGVLGLDSGPNQEFESDPIITLTIRFNQTMRWLILDMILTMVIILILTMVIILILTMIIMNFNQIYL